MLNNLVIAWLLRRALEIGGLVGTIALGALSLWNSLPPGSQEAVMQMLSRNWQGVTLGDLWPLALAIWGYVWSFLSTVKPQVVVDGKQVPIEALPNGKKTLVEESARTAAERNKAQPGLLERLFGKRR